jgi:hypothetical protein
MTVDQMRLSGGAHELAGRLRLTNHLLAISIGGLTVIYLGALFF